MKEKILLSVSFLEYNWGAFVGTAISMMLWVWFIGVYTQTQTDLFFLFNYIGI